MFLQRIWRGGISRAESQARVILEDLRGAVAFYIRGNYAFRMVLCNWQSFNGTRPTRFTEKAARGGIKE